MESIILTNATIFTGEATLSDHALWMENGTIKAILPTSEIPQDENIQDLHGAWLVPGFVDFQLYGGDRGFLTRDGSVESLDNMYRTHLSDGTTTIVPTVYSTTKERIFAAITAVEEYWKQGKIGVAGLHVEGPFLNPIKRGAHSDKMVRPPSREEIEEILEKGNNAVKVLTIAPECFNDSLLELLKQSNWAIATGHTNATSAELNTYFNKGFNLITHLYNAMRPLESRELGVVGTVFDRDDVHASIIVDGHHCDFGAVRIAKKLLGERLFLISDATFAKYQGTRFEFEGFTINYNGKRFLNDDGLLAGSCITLLDAVRNCINEVGIPPDETFRMASAYPARHLGMGHQLGYLKPGFLANVVALSPDLALQQVWAEGQAV